MIRMDEAPEDGGRAAAMERMYRSDRVLIGIFFAAMWAVLAYVLTQVWEIAPDGATRAIAVIAAALVGLFASGALLAAAVHLKKRKALLYREDLENANH
jgi:hypothetical protein